MNLRYKLNSIRKRFGGSPVAVPFAAIIIIAAVFLLTGAAFADNGRGYRVYINADNAVIETRADEVTVGEVLREQGITLDSNDEVYPTAECLITENDTIIKVHRVEYREYRVTEVVPYKTIRKESVNHKLGEEILDTEGVSGITTKLIRNKYVNGMMVNSKAIVEEETEPIDEVILVGTAKNEPVSKREGNFRLVNGIPESYEYKLSGKATAYTAREGCGTYSGRPLVVGSVAVDPEIIPFGSELYIVSKDGSHVYGYAVASDTGDLTEAGVLVDCFMGITETNYDDACRWGARFCDVYVLSVGDNSVSWR